MDDAKVREIPVEQGGGWQIFWGGYVVLDSEEAHEVRDMWVKCEFVLPKLLESLLEIKDLLDREQNEYGVARRDGELMDCDEVSVIKDIFDRADEAIKAATK